MIINTNLEKSIWCVYEDGVELKVKPFPLTHGVFRMAMDNDLANQNWDLFDYCVEDWKGFENEKGEVLECNEENKRIVFNHFPQIIFFVLRRINDSQEELLAQKKI